MLIRIASQTKKGEKMKNHLSIFIQGLSVTGLICLISLGNLLTAKAAPMVRPNPPSYEERRPISPRPVPIRPNPIRPNPRPTPIVPIYPTPVYPRPIYPTPIPIYPPAPVYPAPGYPGYEPPYYPNPTVQRSIYLNRWVQYESLNLTSLLSLNYNYEGYRVKHVYVDVASADSVSIDLLINNRVVDSKVSYGGDVYLYPSYENRIGYDISTLRVGITGGVYIGRIVVELERNY